MKLLNMKLAAVTVSFAIIFTYGLAIKINDNLNFNVHKISSIKSNPRSIENKILKDGKEHFLKPSSKVQDRSNEKRQHKNNRNSGGNYFKFDNKNHQLLSKKNKSQKNNNWQHNIRFRTRILKEKSPEKVTFSNMDLLLKKLREMQNRELRLTNKVLKMIKANRKLLKRNLALTREKRTEYRKSNLRTILKRLLPEAEFLILENTHTDLLKGIRKDDKRKFVTLSKPMKQTVKIPMKNENFVESRSKHAYSLVQNMNHTFYHNLDKRGFLSLKKFLKQLNINNELLVKMSSLFLKPFDQTSSKSIVQTPVYQIQPPENITVSQLSSENDVKSMKPHIRVKKYAVNENYYASQSNYDIVESLRLLFEKINSYQSHKLYFNIVFGCFHSIDQNISIETYQSNLKKFIRCIAANFKESLLQKSPYVNTSLNFSKNKTFPISVENKDLGETSNPSNFLLHADDALNLSQNKSIDNIIVVKPVNIQEKPKVLLNQQVTEPKFPFEDEILNSSLYHLIFKRQLNHKEVGIDNVKTKENSINKNKLNENFTDGLRIVDNMTKFNYGIEESDLSMNNTRIKPETIPGSIPIEALLTLQMMQDEIFGSGEHSKLDFPHFVLMKTRLNYSQPSNFPDEDCVHTKIDYFTESNSVLDIEKYPIASIFLRGLGVYLKYQGEGSFITPNQVLTSAKAVTTFNQIYYNPFRRRLFSPHMVIVRLKRSQNDSDFIDRNVLKIHVINDWLHLASDSSNIALITLTAEMPLNPNNLIQLAGKSDAGLIEQVNCSILAYDRSYICPKRLAITFLSNVFEGSHKKGSINGFWSNCIKYELKDKVSIFIPEGSPLICERKLYGITSTNLTLRKPRSAIQSFIRIEDSVIDWINNSILQSKTLNALMNGAAKKYSTLYLMFTVIVAMIISKFPDI